VHYLLAVSNDFKGLWLESSRTPPIPAIKSKRNHDNMLKLHHDITPKRYNVLILLSWHQICKDKNVETWRRWHGDCVVLALSRYRSHAQSPNPCQITEYINLGQCRRSVPNFSRQSRRLPPQFGGSPTRNCCGLIGESIRA